MMLVCGTLHNVLCYTRYDGGLWHSPDCDVHIRYDAGCVALFRLCCGTLDMMLGVWYSTTVLCYTRYDAEGVTLSRLCCARLDMMLGGWPSPDSPMLHQK